MSVETRTLVGDHGEGDRRDWREWTEEMDPEARANSRELSPGGAAYLMQDVGRRGLGRLGRMGTTGISASGFDRGVRTGYTMPRRITKQELLDLGQYGLTGYSG